MSTTTNLETSLGDAIAIYSETRGCLLRGGTWKSNCRYWTDALGDATPIASITSADINASIAAMKRRGLANSTIAARMQTLKMVFKSASQAIPGLRFPEYIARVGASNERVRYLTPSEEMALRRVLHPRDWQIVELAILLGLRSMELFTLERRDVDLVKGFVTIRSENSKNGCAGRAPANNPKTIKILKSMLERSGSKYVVIPRGFEHYNSRSAVCIKWKDRVFRPALRAAGIEDFHFHDTRHTCASRIAQKNGSLLTIQKYLRQKDLKMALRYSHLCDDTLKKAAMLL